LFFTYSRGSYFGLIALAIFLFFKKLNIYKIALFLIVILLSFTFLYEGILYRFNKQDRAVMESNYDRVILLQSAYKMLKSNYFIFGNGMLTFSIAKYEHSFPKWADKDKILSTHNFYLEHFVGLGLFGILGISFILFGTFFSLVRLKVPDADKGIKFGLLFSLLSCILHGFVDCQAGNIAFSLPLFTILASSAFLICENKIVIRNHGKAISATDLR
jgi:O-antigen ligase